MGRITFGDDGKPVGVDGNSIKSSDSTLHGFHSIKHNPRSRALKSLKTSDSLEFLKPDKEVGDIFSKNYWSLYENGKNLEPLTFTNGKTQEDVVKEIVSLVNSKENQTKVIFLHGTCGSGKSAIALNIARVLGKTSIVVPVRALQKQYEEDYITKKYLSKSGGKKMRIAMITGKENHDSIIKPGSSCADPMLPENIKFVDKNSNKILEYIKDNPFIKNPNRVDFENIRRVMVAAANPYWSPILPASFELKSLTDASKRRYKGCDGQDFIFYHRKSGCSYYDQYLSYADSDVIIFNSAKYRAELSLGRKPLTEVDIIDEADEFLDQFFQQGGLNITRLLASARNFYPESLKSKRGLDKVRKALELEEKNKRLLGIREDVVFHVSDTKLREIFEELHENHDLEAEITLDEFNYLNKALEIADTFKGSMKELYLTYRKNDEGNIIAKLVSTDISGKFQDLLNKTKVLIFMSGTLHSENIIKNIFGIEDFKVVHAENLNFGSIDIIMTGKEFDCKYSNFASKKYSRVDYLDALSSCIEKSPMPALIHVNAFRDLPDEKEKGLLELKSLMSSEEIKSIQESDNLGHTISDFKKGRSKMLFSTKCSRGVDFPGETCNSVIFTKYPNPDVSDTFWKVLGKTHPNHYWEFYKDKAWREFLQRIYRALRSPTDHVNILSPDKRVIEAVRILQRKMMN